MHRVVLDVDLADLNDVTGLGNTRQAHILVRYRGIPLCRIRVPVFGGEITSAELLTAVQQSAGNAFAQRVLSSIMRAEGRAEESAVPLPPCTILVCTRDRPDDLDRCLHALSQFASPDVEIIVVDNDPPDERTRDVSARYPVRYFRQERRGVNWARARGARLATHDLLLYVDDDVVVDSAWLDEIRKPFADEHVGAVTGSVEPLELETEGQDLHEDFSSFYRGFEPKVFNLLNTLPAAAGLVGAGANMAVRRSIAVKYSIFEAELDGGTDAKSGGDHYGLYLILKAGYSVVYWPRALAWHRHRRTHRDLYRMLYGYSVGGICVLLSAFFRDRDWDAVYVTFSWLRSYHLRELWRSLRKLDGSRPLSLILTEIRGAIQAPWLYAACRRRERAIGPLA